MSGESLTSLSKGKDRNFMYLDADFNPKNSCQRSQKGFLKRFTSSTSNSTRGSQRTETSLTGSTCEQRRFVAKLVVVRDVVAWVGTRQKSNPRSFALGSAKAKMITSCVINDFCVEAKLAFRYDCSQWIEAIQGEFLAKELYYIPNAPFEKQISSFEKLAELVFTMHWTGDLGQKQILATYGAMLRYFVANPTDIFGELFAKTQVKLRSLPQFDKHFATFAHDFKASMVSKSSQHGLHYELLRNGVYCRTTKPMKGELLFFSPTFLWRRGDAKLSENPIQSLVENAKSSNPSTVEAVADYVLYRLQQIMKFRFSTDKEEFLLRERRMIVTQDSIEAKWNLVYSKIWQLLSLDQAERRNLTRYLESQITHRALSQ